MARSLLRTRLVLVSASLLVPLAVTRAASDAQSATQRPHTETFEAVAIVDSARGVDNPPPGDSQGDIITFTQKLFTNATQEHMIGTDEAYCIRTVPDTSRVCTGIFYLRNGTITITGPESVEPHSLAITGGTGRWRGARGEIALVPNGELEDHMTFHVEFESSDFRESLPNRRR